MDFIINILVVSLFIVPIIYLYRMDKASKQNKASAFSLHMSTQDKDAILQYTWSNGTLYINKVYQCIYILTESKGDISIHTIDASKGVDISYQTKYNNLNVDGKKITVLNTINLEYTLHNTKNTIILYDSQKQLSVVDELSAAQRVTALIRDVTHPLNNPAMP